MEHTQHCPGTAQHSFLFSLLFLFKVCVEIMRLQCFIYPLVPPQSQVLPKELQHASLGLHLSNFYIPLKSSTYG